MLPALSPELPAITALKTLIQQEYSEQMEFLALVILTIFGLLLEIAHLNAMELDMLEDSLDQTKNVNAQALEQLFTAGTLLIQPAKPAQLEKSKSTTDA